MKVRALGTDGDWTFGRGRNDYLSATDAIAQNIKTRLMSFRGDCFFDADAGVDWFTHLGSKDRQALELSVRLVILNTDGVTAFTSFQMELDETRQVTISYGVQTVYSTVVNAQVSV